MRHLSGGKTDLKADLLINSFILFLLSISSLTFSQIPINGFCSQKNYPLPKGYEGIVISDLNSDGNDELIFYSQSSKKIGIYSAIPDTNAVLKEFGLSQEISQLKQIKNPKGEENLFAAIDRKHRKIFLIEISSDSITVRKEQIEFDSYPENIFIRDIQNDNEEEILVYGIGFDGLSILSVTGDGIGERKLITGTSFSDAVFIDYNDDGYSDVVAFNIIENSLQFFTNNTNGIFRLNRSVRFTEKISYLRAIDLNNDNLPDLIYSTGNYLYILFGDYQATFSTKETIKLEDQTNGIIFCDFNNDRFTDICFSLLKGTVNILFSKKASDFYESVTYLKNISSIPIARFRYKQKDNILCFLQSGEISTITSVSDLSEDIRIVPAVHATAVTKFDFGNDNFTDIGFVDKYDKNLKIFLLNKSGIPSLLYYFPLAEDHTEIKVDDYYKQIKTFYCYSEGTPLLEVFNYNFKTSKLNRKQLYAPGEILDLKLHRVDSSQVNIFLAYNKKSKLYAGKFEYREQSITFKEYPFIDRNVSSAKIRIQNKPEIFYWNNERNTYSFKLVDIEQSPIYYRTYFTIPDSENVDIKLYGSEYYYNNYPTIISFVQNNFQRNTISFTGNKFNKSNMLFNNSIDTRKNFGRGFFGEIALKGIINFSVNTIDDNYINTLIYNEKSKIFLLSKTVHADSISDFFFMRNDTNNYYLVYSNTEGELLITSVKK